MTYCVGLRLDRGLIFMSDTRTNAGVDNISSYRKIRTWERPGERLITLLSAGNLATTQAVFGLLEEHEKPASERSPGILTTESMFQTARLVGETVRNVIRDSSEGGPQSEATFAATFILGGQIEGGRTRLYLIYPEGNFIEATDDNPFFQIGEHKYGKPILVRAYDPGMSFEKAAKLLLVSFEFDPQVERLRRPPAGHAGLRERHAAPRLRASSDRRRSLFQGDLRRLVGCPAGRFRQPARLQLRLKPDLA